MISHLQTKRRDGCCIITRGELFKCHGAHNSPFSLKRTEQKATLDLWKVLEMFWGPERKVRPQQLILGPHDTKPPNSKTQINPLYNLITLSPDTHSRWAHGKFSLELLGAEVNPHKMGARVQWTPQRSELPKNLG